MMNGKEAVEFMRTFFIDDDRFGKLCLDKPHIQRLVSLYNALLAEHEAVGELINEGFYNVPDYLQPLEQAHAKVEEVEQVENKYFFCSALNGPCSTMTEAEEIEADLRSKIKDAEEVIEVAHKSLHIPAGYGTKDFIKMVFKWRDILRDSITAYRAKHGGGE